MKLDMKEWINKVTNALKSDYIVEQGTSGIWNYRKWNSGIAECWGIGTISGTWSSWSSHYYIENIFTYPFGFVSRPSMQATAQAISTLSSGSIISVGSYTRISEEDAKSECNVALFRPTAGQNNANYTVNLYAIGRWK